MNNQGYPQPQFPHWQPQPQPPRGQTQWGQQPLPPYNGPPIPNHVYPQQIPFSPSTKQAQKKRINKLGWIAALVVILVCLLLITFLVNPGKGSNSHTLGNSKNTVTNQTITALQPTETPTLAPTPTYAPGFGYHMMLGHSYSCSPACLIDNPTNQFSPTSQFAFVVLMWGETFNTTQVKLLLVKLGETGSESVVYVENIPLADPNENNLWNSFPTSSLMGNNPYGNYRLEIEDDTSIRAYANFIYAP